MKTIHILYSSILNQQQKQLAQKISSILHKAGYQTKLICLNTNEEIKNYITCTSTSDRQLIITINMSGFGLSTTGNDPALNTVPVNIVNYINTSPKLFDVHFHKSINYTMSFILNSKISENYIKENYPHIFHVTSTESLTDFLPAYLEKLDWRY